MDDQEKQLWKDLREEKIEINDQELFLSILTKGLIYDLNKTLKVRGEYIPHYILNTGDDIMYLEVKGQDHSKEPLETVNEKFVYSQIPRCMIKPAGMNIPAEQLTSPYSHGTFQMTYEDMIYTFRSEFRRVPLTLTFNLKYYFDSLTDAFQAVQQFITKLVFINTFSIVYLGQTIKCSYKVPDDYTTEFMMEFDGATTDNKYRNFSIDIAVDSNIPVVYPRTIIPGDKFIKNFMFNPDLDDPTKGSNTPKENMWGDKVKTVNGSTIGIYPIDGIAREVNGERVVGKDYDLNTQYKSKEN